MATGQLGWPLLLTNEESPLFQHPLKLVLHCWRDHPFFCILQAQCGTKIRKFACSPPCTFPCVTLSHFRLPLYEGENTKPPSHLALLQLQPLFPASSTIALKLLGCPHVQAASKSCLKMARCDEKHLIMAPKIHRPRIALHSLGKKSKRGPRTETFQVAPPRPPWKLEESSITFSLTLKLWWLYRNHIHKLSPASRLGLTSCPTTDWQLVFRKHLTLAGDGDWVQLSEALTITEDRAFMSNGALKCARCLCRHVPCHSPFDPHTQLQRQLRLLLLL